MRGLLKRSGKRTLCGIVSSRNQKPPSWEKARLATALYHAEAFVSLPKSTPSRIIRANVRLRVEEAATVHGDQQLGDAVAALPRRPALLRMPQLSMAALL